jgi:Na+/H+ antiporter NhaD/arsenite permease-like protein
MTPKPLVHLSSIKFLAACAGVAALIAGVGVIFPFPAWVDAAEIGATVLALFVFGSIRFRLDKNALAYGAALVVAATFWTGWWPASGLRHSIAAEGALPLWNFIHRHLLTFEGWDRLVHADTMLFILGLTFFVAVIAETRLLETAGAFILDRCGGWVVPTVALIAALVAATSGVLDGVSMIGLMIRMLVVLLFLAKAPDASVIFAVMISTIVTTVCGMWLAYGEPPNLIMKANLHPVLNDAFFLRYCLPVAIGSYLIVLWNLRRKLKGLRVDRSTLDLLDHHAADVRYLQTERHGRTMIPVEFAVERAAEMGLAGEAVQRRIHEGIPLGEAMVNEGVPRATRLRLLGDYLADDLAPALDDYYVHVYGKNDHSADEAARLLHRALHRVRRDRRRAQWLGLLSFLPFVALLIVHALNHHVPLFWASLAGFAVSLTAVVANRGAFRAAMRSAAHEFNEYLFLVPLFFSVTLLQKTGFFNQVAGLLQSGVDHLGPTHTAAAQFAGTTILSAVLDNNVVADFAGRALQGLDLVLLKFFALAQIAGYAVGGCWTHIGSAQSVVAYSFILKEINPHFTPWMWIRAMTPVILEMVLLMAVVLYAGSHLFLKGFP